MNLIIKQKGVNFGLILGLIFVLITLYSYAIDPTWFASIWVLIAVFFTVIILGIIAIAFAKKGLNGFITFKDAFTTYFIMLIIGLAASTLMSIILFNFVDPDFKKVVVEQQVQGQEEWREWTTSKMIDGGSSDAEIEEVDKKFDDAIEEIRSVDKYAIGQQVKSFFIGTSVFSLFGLLLALILKKKDPSLE